MQSNTCLGLGTFKESLTPSKLLIAWLSSCAHGYGVCAFSKRVYLFLFMGKFFGEIKKNKLRFDW